MCLFGDFVVHFLSFILCFNLIITKKGKFIFLNLGICLLGTQLRIETVPSYAALFILEKKPKKHWYVFTFSFWMLFFFPGLSEKTKILNQPTQLSSFPGKHIFFLHFSTLKCHVLSHPFTFFWSFILFQGKRNAHSATEQSRSDAIALFWPFCCTIH